MNKISFCIILYNKKMSESSSILTLINYFINIEILGDIIVFNNGPNIIENEYPNHITLHQILINASLSKIYNKFINKYDANYYVFLDDDSSLSHNYLNELKENKADIFLPRIYCKDIEYYPSIKKFSIQSITSGLTLSQKICKKLVVEYGSVFDERFDLYGIDTAFFYRLNKEHWPYVISHNKIDHDLSHITENNNFRQVEVLLANSAALIPYFRFKLLVSIGYMYILMLKKFKFKEIISSMFSIALKRVIRLWKF